MTADANPLLIPSPLPCGLPDYAAIRPRRTTFPRSASPSPYNERRGARSALHDDPPTFAKRVSAAFYTASSADATPEIQPVEEELAPLMSAHQDTIALDDALYARISRLAAQEEELELAPEQHRLSRARRRRQGVSDRAQPASLHP